MADRGRDFKFALLSDLDKFDLDPASRDLDKLARDATTAGRDIEQALDGTGQDFDKLSRGARDVGRDVGRSFDTIAREARTGARKVETGTDGMRRSLDDVSDEARDTGREMAASFDGTGEGLLDAAQELSANAGVAFGPLGAAFGVVAGSLVGIFRAETARINEEVDALVEYMKDAGGRLNEEAIKARILETDPAELAKLRDLADAVDIAGVTYERLARAKVGDEQAQKDLNAALDEAATKYDTVTDAAGLIDSTAELYRSRIQDVRGSLNDWTKSTDLAREAIDNMNSATRVAGDTAVTSTEQTKQAWDELGVALKDPVRARIILDKPSAGELVNVRADLTRGIGTIVVPVRPGQSRFSNTSSNSRYRE